MNAMRDAQDVLVKLRNGLSLNESESQALIDGGLTGKIEPIQLASALSLMAMRGETACEITGAARSLRAHMIALDVPYDTLDVCGTGGDGQNTVNISTATAFVLAAGGIKVAKHGNRSITSRSGAADVLTALGIKIDCQLESQRICLDEVGICFLFAPNHHPMMKSVAAIRKSLGFRTLFNLLGPLSNPASAKRQVLGVATPELIPVMAESLRRLGCHFGMVVNSAGLDELSYCGESIIQGLNQTDGLLPPETLMPSDLNRPQIAISQLRGADAQFNACRLVEMFETDEGAYFDSVCLNAAAGMIIAEKAQDWQSAITLSEEIIKSGKAMNTLKSLAQYSQKLP